MAQQQQRTHRLSRILRDTLGQSVAEFAIVLPLLLTTFFGIFEFGRYYYTRISLQHAVREATRFAVTGNVLIDDESGDPLSRPNSIIRVIVENTSNIDVDLENVTITPADGGGPEDIVRVAVEFRYDLKLPFLRNIVPNGHIDLTYSTAMRNEAFYE